MFREKNGKPSPITIARYTGGDPKFGEYVMVSRGEATPMNMQTRQDGFIGVLLNHAVKGTTLMYVCLPSGDAKAVFPIRRTTDQPYNPFRVL